MRCTAIRHTDGDRAGRYHGSRRAVGVTLLRCVLPAGHDGLHRCELRGRWAYFVAERYL